MSKKAKKPRGVVNTFLFLVNLTGVIMIVISNFVSNCQLQVSTDPADLAQTQKMKDLGFAGPGFGVTEGGQETHEWQKNFPDKCPPPPSGYLEADVTYKGHVQPGKFWRPATIAVFLVIFDFLAFLFLKKQKGGRALLPA